MEENWKENINDFKCRVCNFPLILYEIQAKRDVTIFKAKCPVHGYGVLKIPTGEVSKLIPEISDRVFRCFTCGAPATINELIDKDVWKLLKVKCPTHGVSRRSKINYHVFSEIWTLKQKELQKIAPEQKSSITEQIPIENLEENLEEKSEETRDEIKFCRNCGVELKSDYLFCNKCGTKIIKLPIAKPKKDQNYCGVCGYPLDHGYHFCIRCGAKI